MDHVIPQKAKGGTDHADNLSTAVLKPAIPRRERSLRPSPMKERVKRAESIPWKPQAKDVDMTIRPPV